MREGRVGSAIWFTFLIVLTGCNQSNQMERKAPKEVAEAKVYFNLLRTGHSAEVEDAFDPEMKDADFRSQFDEMVATIPTQDPARVTTIWVNPEYGKGVLDYHIILEYTYPTERLLFNVVLANEGGGSSLLGIHIRVIPESVMKTYDFRFDKGFRQYVVLAFAIILPLFSFYALTVCLRSKIGLHKWLWAIFILLGFGKFSVNWATGKFDFHLLAIQVLSAGAFAERYSPWVISISLPLGAILFLTLHEHFARSAQN